jgi:hypothetical protein
MRPPGIPLSWVKVQCAWCGNGVWFDPAVGEQAAKVGQRIKHSCSEACSAQLLKVEPSMLANMSTALGPLWDIAALKPGTEIDIGRLVACDDCGTDYTDAKDTGGFIWHNRASCPECADRKFKALPTQQLLTLMRKGLHCPSAMSFADFVREVRGENAKIKINPPKGH